MIQFFLFSVRNILRQYLLLKKIYRKNIKKILIKHSNFVYFFVYFSLLAHFIDRFVCSSNVNWIWFKPILNRKQITNFLELNLFFQKCLQGINTWIQSNPFKNMAMRMQSKRGQNTNKLKLVRKNDYEIDEIKWFH